MTAPMSGAAIRARLHAVSIGATLREKQARPQLLDHPQVRRELPLWLLPACGRGGLARLLVALGSGGHALRAGGDRLEALRLLAGRPRLLAAATPGSGLVVAGLDRGELGAPALALAGLGRRLLPLHLLSDLGR